MKELTLVLLSITKGVYSQPVVKFLQTMKLIEIKTSQTFIKDLFQILQHKFKLIHQIDYLGSYNPRLNTIKNGLIDWNFSSRDLYNFINAFDDPYPGASTFLDRGNFGKLHLKKVHLHAGDGSNHSFMSGIVSRHDKDWIVVSTTDKYMLLIESIINQKGENIISKIRPGDRFYTPVEKLSAAKSSRVTYTSKG